MAEAAVVGGIGGIRCVNAAFGRRGVTQRGKSTRAALVAAEIRLMTDESMKLCLGTSRETEKGGQRGQKCFLGDHSLSGSVTT